LAAAFFAVFFLAAFFAGLAAALAAFFATGASASAAGADDALARFEVGVSSEGARAMEVTGYRKGRLYKRPARGAPVGGPRVGQRRLTPWLLVQRS
jgi:hypothetical protein